MKRQLYDLWRAAVEGKFFDVLIKKINHVLGVISRKILSIITPVDNNKVFFMTQESKYVCNPKYISKELQKRRPDLDIVWRDLGKGDTEIPDSVRKVKLNTLDYFKEIFSSKVIVANSFLYVGETYSLKKGQILIETWHGSLGIKRHDAEAMGDDPRKKALIKTGKQTAYCISNSALETSSLSSTYWPQTPMLEYGHARNDLFFENHSSEYEGIRKKIFDRYGIEKNAHIVMYAPTFRDNKSFEYYDIDFDRLLRSLNEKFGGEWYAFLRYHPSMAKTLPNYLKANINENVINVTDYVDMQELILVTDVAITDYSSWIYDFVLLRRPGFIFATDIEEYKNNERGFYYPIEETPFGIAANNDELEKLILEFDEIMYLKEVEQFLKDKGCVEDGHASERVVDLIESVLKI